MNGLVAKSQSIRHLWSSDQMEFCHGADHLCTLRGARNCPGSPFTLTDFYILADRSSR